MKKNQLTKGIALAFATAVVSGISIFYSKVAVLKIDPLVLTTSRNMIVGLLFAALLITTKRYRELRGLSGKDAARLILIGIIGGSLPFYLFFSGLKLIGAQQANMIHKTLFIWVALLSPFFLKERINIKTLFAGLLIFAGTYLIAPLRPILGQGAVMVFAAALLWSLETVIAKKVLSQVSPDLVGASRMFFGGAVLAAVTIFTGKGSALLALNPSQITVIIIGAALLFTYVYTWYRALAAAPAHAVTFILTASLLVGNVLNGAFANLRLVPADWFSMVLVGGGVVLTAVGSQLAFTEKT